MTEEEKAELIAFGKYLMEKGNRPSAIRDVFRNRVRDAGLRNELLAEIFRYKPPVKEDTRTPEQKKRDLELMKARHIVSDFKGQNQHSLKLGIVTLGVALISLLFGLPYAAMTALQGLIVIMIFAVIIKKRAYHLINGILLSFAGLVVAELLLFGMPDTLLDDLFSTERTKVYIILDQVTPFIYLAYKLAIIMLLIYNLILKRKYDKLPPDIRYEADPL